MVEQSMSNVSGLEASVNQSRREEWTIETSGQRMEIPEWVKYVELGDNVVKMYEHQPENANNTIMPLPPLAYYFQFPRFTNGKTGGIHFYTKREDLVERNGDVYMVLAFSYSSGITKLALREYLNYLREKSKIK